MNNRQLKKSNLKDEQRVIQKIEKSVDDHEKEESPANPHMRVFKKVIIAILIFVDSMAGFFVFTRLIVCSILFARELSLHSLGFLFTEAISLAIVIISIYYLCVELNNSGREVSTYSLWKHREPLSVALWILVIQAIIMVIFMISDCLIPVIQMSVKGNFTNVSASTMGNITTPVLLSAMAILSVIIADWIRKAEKTAVINFSSLALAVISLLISFTGCR